MCKKNLKIESAFVCNNCKWQLLYAIIANDNFCKHHCNWQVLFVLLQVITSCLYAYFKFPFLVGTIGTGILVMHCCIWYFCTMLVKIFKSFYIWQLLYAPVMYDCNVLLPLTCSIAIENFFMPYCNWKPLHSLLHLLTLVFTLYIIS